MVLILPLNMMAPYLMGQRGKRRNNKGNHAEELRAGHPGSAPKMHDTSVPQRLGWTMLGPNTSAADIKAKIKYKYKYKYKYNYNIKLKLKLKLKNKK